MQIGPIMLGSAILIPQIIISEIISYFFDVPAHRHPPKRAPLTEVTVQPNSRPFFWMNNQNPCV